MESYLCEREPMAIAQQERTAIAFTQSSERTSKGGADEDFTSCRLAVLSFGTGSRRSVENFRFGGSFALPQFDRLGCENHTDSVNVARKCAVIAQRLAPKRLYKNQKRFLAQIFRGVALGGHRKVVHRVLPMQDRAAPPRRGFADHHIT
jgi:hypothetical protein